MIRDERGAFSIDFVAAYSVLIALILCAFFAASNVVSVRYTASYANDLAPLVENVGNGLLHGQGEPREWYVDPAVARTAKGIGLSGGAPNVLTEDRIGALSFYDPPALRGILGLSEEYGLRLEIRSNDGAISRSSGYLLPPDTKDVCKSIRAASIESPDGTYRSATMIVYLWRKNVGTADE